MINTELFTGKAQFYVNARPGYPDAALEYIGRLVPAGAVFADIGAGTGKFSLELARRGYGLFAVEPNADMRAQLALVLAPFPRAKVVAGSAEATTLDGRSVDAIICAQALHWFDPDAFREECGRIGRANAWVIALYNTAPEGSAHSEKSTGAFFQSPAVREFPNPLSYTRESWLQYMMSHSHSPLPSDPGYAAHIAEMNAIFDRESVNGVLYQDIVTKVYSEKI